MMDGLAADEDGQCRNVQGGGEEEEVLLGCGARGGNNLNIREEEAHLGCGARGGINRNIREEEANHGLSAEGNFDPDEKRMLCLMHALHIKVSIPVFKGDKNEDPIEFKTKALDYMEATDIPI